MNRNDELKKAISYVKKLTRKTLYHSQTIKKKMSENFSSQTINKVISIMEQKGAINDELFVKKLLDLYIKKGYGNQKLKQYILNKNIPIYVYSEFTYDMEEQSIVNAYKINYNYFDRFVGEEKTHKIYAKMQYLGFSNDSISYIIRKIKGNEI